MGYLIIICIILCSIGLVYSIYKTIKEYKHDKQTKEKLKRFKYPNEPKSD